MNDVRDEALGALLERAAVGIESVPADRLPEVLRRGTWRRTGRFIAAAAAVAVFVGAISWAGLSIRDENTAIPADVDDWRTFASLEDNGWTMQVPPSWRVQELPACPNAPERIGVVVTNTDFEFLSPRGTPPECEDRFVFAGFPRDGVALAFHPRGTFPGFFEPQMDTTLPLAPELLMRTGDIEGGPLHTFQSVALDREWLGVIRRFVGPDASVSDVAALDRMLGSFSVRGAPHWVNAEASTSRLRVRITHPQGWNVTRFHGVTVIDAPQPILLATTPGVREGYSFCLGGPYGEFRTIGRSGVVVAISDATGGWGSGRGFGARPATLRPSEARYDDTVTCSGDVRRLGFQFEEAGRPIVVDVLVSTTFMREEPWTLRYILDSIRVEKI